MSGELLDGILRTAIEVLFPILLGFVVWGIKEGIAWIKANVDQRKLETAIGIVSQLVMAAEQNGLAGYIKDESKVKRDWVIAQLQESLAARGIKIDVKELYALIEAQVFETFNQYKDEFNLDLLDPDVEPDAGMG